MVAIPIIEGLLTAEQPMSSTQKVQAHLDEKKPEQNQAVSAKKAHSKELDSNMNTTSPKGRESVENSSRMRRRKLVLLSVSRQYLAVKHAITFEPHGMPPSNLAQTKV
jgi:hypothetical protein